jgi:predicted transglutaminase-like cysteine proteinase
VSWLRISIGFVVGLVLLGFFTPHARGQASVRTDLAPYAFAPFCDRNPTECQVSGPAVETIELTGKRLRELIQVNRSVNKAVLGVRDLDRFNQVDVWDFPRDGMGDCEDYVILKRHQLRELGWPSSVLLITVVLDPNGEGHAVLAVRTSRGTLILDNQDGRLLAPRETRHFFVKHQSPGNPRAWIWSIL